MAAVTLVEDPRLDWESSETSFFLNPRDEAATSEIFKGLAAAAPKLAGHLWIASSGTQSASRLLALSKEAFLCAARAVNAHLNALPGEPWLCALPTFHVSGLSIYARAHLSGSRVHLLSQWSAQNFVKLVDREQVTFTSLVPTQVFDLIQANLAAPPSLRAVLVGGDALAPHLSQKARDLGWPLLACYGMSETAAMLAAAPLPRVQENVTAAFLKLLPHCKVRSAEGGELEVQSASLLSGELSFRQGQPFFYDPKINGWFKTRDLVTIHKMDDGTWLEYLGRTEDFLKIGGELVNIAVLQREIEQIVPADALLVTEADERLGIKLHLLIKKGTDLSPLIRLFRERFRPFERPRGYSEVDEIPRSTLGKALKKDVSQLIRCNNKNMPLG